MLLWGEQSCPEADGKKPFKLLSRRHDDRANAGTSQWCSRMDKEEGRMELGRKLQSGKDLLEEMLTCSVQLWSENMHKMSLCRDAV